MTTLLYCLHSGNLYGTERMALATVEGLRDEFDSVLIAPPGPIHEEAQRRGFKTMIFQGPLPFLRQIRPFFAENRRLAMVGTRVLHTLAASFWAGVYRTDCANLQIVHGGADERLSYGRKRWLTRLNAKQVAISDYVKSRLVANGCLPQEITVIENFLSAERLREVPCRPASRGGEIRKVVIVSRLDPIKRLDLLFDALDLQPTLRSLQFEIYGTGQEEGLLRARGMATHPNVTFMGFRSDVPARMAQSDLFLHLCPEEPFGLVILEAMAAGLPVLVPDSGGAGDIVRDGRNGFRFRANDALDLAHKLQDIQRMPSNVIQKVVAEGSRALRTRYSPECGVAEYRRLIQECLA